VIQSQQGLTGRRATWAVALAFVLLPLFASSVRGQAIGLPVLSEASQECVECHKKENLALYQMWGDSN